MTILISISTPDFTGGPRMGWVMTRALKFAGHRILVVSGPRPPVGQSSVLDAFHDDGIETISESGFERTIPDRALIKRISSLVRRENVKLMISLQQQDFRVMPFVAIKTSAKLVFYVQNAAKFSGNPITMAIKRLVYQQLLTRATAKLICCSEMVRDQHIQRFGVPASRTVVVDNGVDLSRFRPISPERRCSIRTELGIADDELMLLNVGRLSLQKGQDLLLRALASANLNGRKFKMVIVGAATHGMSESDAAYIANLHRLAELPALAGRVVFAGWRDDIPKILQSADVYLHSANWEGMPLAVLEAMAAGLPSVSTDCAGVLTGFAPGEHGYLVQTGNEKAFRDAIEQLVGLSDVERTKMGHAAETLAVTNFDIDVLSKRFVFLVEQELNDVSTATACPPS